MGFHGLGDLDDIRLILSHPLKLTLKARVNNSDRLFHVVSYSIDSNLLRRLKLELIPDTDACL